MTITIRLVVIPLILVTYAGAQTEQIMAGPTATSQGVGRFGDKQFNPQSRETNCRKVPLAYAAFDAHSSALGFEYFTALEINKSGFDTPL
jgi:hypothetical protein